MKGRAAAGMLLGGLAACGGDPATTAGSEDVRPWFREEALERGLVFHHRSGHGERHYFPELMGGGAALFDMDGDGDLDAFLVQSGSLVEEGPAGHKLFENDGAGHFRDVTEQSGVDVAGYGQGVAAADADGDGDVDLYVTNVGPNVLLRNEGGGRFTDVTADAGVGDPGWGTSAAFFDMDGDGDLDLYVANYVVWSLETELDCKDPTGQPDYCSPTSYQAPAPDVLFRNEGGGTFRDVTDEVGMVSGFGNGLGVVAADFTGDGRPDVFVANDQTPDQLWVQQDDGTFQDQGETRGVARDPYGGVRAGMGVDFEDVDGDEDLDLIVVHLARETDGFFRNNGRHFVEETTRVGIGMADFMMTRFGVRFVDLDLDGWLDLYVASGRVNKLLEPVSEDDVFAEPNVLMRGMPDGRWKTVEPTGGTVRSYVRTSRGAAFGDVDGDGAVDVLVVNRDAPAHLFRNVAPDRGHGLVLRLVDRGRDAIGASARLVVDGRPQRRDVKAGSSYCAASDPRLVFGLGVATGVDEVVVRWIDGSEEVFGPLTSGTTHTLARGEGRVR